MTKQDLIRMMMEEMGYSRRDSKELIDKTFNTIKTAMLRGENIKITNFGNFMVRRKRSRVGRNPRTKEEHVIKERTTVVFRPATMLRKVMKKS